MSDLKVAENIVASVHYTGTLPDTGEVFDTSEERSSHVLGRAPTNDSWF